MLRQNYVGFLVSGCNRGQGGSADTIKEDEEEEEEGGLQYERLEDEVRRHRAIVITSMRFRTWELSVICTTDATHTQLLFFLFEGGGEHDGPRQHTHKHKQNTTQTSKKMTYK